MAQIAELRHFNIITSVEEQVMIKKVDDWSKVNPNGVGD